MTCPDDPVILQNYTGALPSAGCKPDFIYAEPVSPDDIPLGL